VVGAHHRIVGDARPLFEGPALFEHAPVHHRHRHQVLQPLERVKDQGAVRPGTGVADVKTIASGLGAVSALPVRAGTAIGGQPIAEAGLLALERAVAGFVPLVMPLAVDQKSHASSAVYACQQDTGAAMGGAYRSPVSVFPAEV